MSELQRWIDLHVITHRTVVVGVGNRLRGDDGAGPALVDRMAGRGRTYAFDAGTVPENFLGVLEALRPQLVLFVDALDHGAAPGACAVVPADSLRERDGGTHAPTLRLLSGWLADAGAHCWVLGVQPGASRTGEGLSPEVERTVDALAAALSAAFEREVSHA